MRMVTFHGVKEDVYVPSEVEAGVTAKVTSLYIQDVLPQCEVQLMS